MWRWLVQDFHNLGVWKKSHELVLRLYRLTSVFPKEEIYGLRSYLRREATTIPTKIAEGCGSAPDFSRCLHAALGAASQVEYLLLLAKDLDYLRPEDHAPLEEATIEVKKMLAGLLNKLRGN